MASPVLRNRFRQIIREAIDPILKPLGFVKRGQVYRKQLPELWWVMDVQRSRWNTSQECDFTCNVGIHVPNVRSMYYPEYPEPELPDVPHCIINARIGALNPDRELDLWWRLRIDDEQSVDETIKGELNKELTLFVLSFFERFRTRTDAIAYLEYLRRFRSEMRRGSYIEPNDSWLPIYLGILYWMEGNQEACCENLAQAKLRALSSNRCVREIESLVERICPN
jgi:hypothetical protein